MYVVCNVYDCVFWSVGGVHAYGGNDFEGPLVVDPLVVELSKVELCDEPVEPVAEG